jgi:hypothetical protein
VTVHYLTLDDYLAIAVEVTGQQVQQAAFRREVAIPCCRSPA